MIIKPKELQTLLFQAHISIHILRNRIKSIGITYTNWSCPTIKSHLRRNQTGKVKYSFPLEDQIQNEFFWRQILTKQ